ncbi:hypothetical protein NESM_000483400 [Novymonas esmeraldas]|uniref:Uncharacterized protein n=1 Tax=Novymonas esmeraldas TaxID=1808958 RepID=A0AAW0EQV2_9TRYP
MPLTASTVRGHARDTQQQQRQQHHHHHHPSRNSSSSSADTTHKSSRGASISFDELVYLNHVLEEDVRDDGDGHRRGGVATTVASRLATAAVQKRGSRVPSPDAVCFDELLGACTVEGGYVLDVYTALLSPDRGARASESGSTPHAGHQHPSPRQEQRSRRVGDDGEGGGGAGGGGGAVEAAHPTHPHYSHHRHQRRAAGAGTGETVAPSDITAAGATLDRHRGPLTRDLPTQSTASAARELERTSACTAERSPPHHQQQQQQQQEQQRRLSQPLSSTAIAATASAAAACAVPPTLFEGDTARRSRTAHVSAATTDTGATAAEGQKCRRVADAPPSLTVEAATASVAPLHHRPSRGVAAAQQPQHTSSSFDNGRVLSDAAAAAAAAAALGGGRRGLEESLMSQQGRHPIAGGTETTQSRRIIDGGVAALDRHPPNMMSTNIGFWDYVDPRELSTMEVTAGPWRHGTLGGDSGGRNVTDAQDPPHTPQSPAHPRMGILSLLPPRGSVVSRPPSAAATASGRLGGPPPPPRPSRPHMSSGVYSNRGYYSFGFFASSLRHGSAVVGPTALPVGGGGDGRAVDTHAEVMRVEHVPAAPTTMTRTHGRRRTSPPAAPPPPQPSDGAQHAEAPPPHGGQSAAVSSGGVAARRPEISFFTLSDMPAALTAALTSPASQPVEPHDTAEAEAGEGRSTACRNRDDCGGRRSGAAASDVAVSARHRPTATEAAQNHPTAPRGASEDAHPHHSQTPDRVDDGGYGMRHLSSETSTSSSSSSSSSSSRESNAHYNYGTQFRFQYRFPSTSPAADDGDGGFHRAPEDSAATAEARTSPTAPPPSLQPRRRDHISSTTTTTTDARSYASGLIRNAGSLFSAQHGSYGDGFYTSLSCLSDDSARLEDVALHSDGDADRDSSGVPHRNSDGSHDDHDDDGGSSSDSDATEVDRESRPSSGLWVHGSILTLPFEPQVTETASRVDGVSDGAAAAWSSSSGGAPVAVVEANDAPRREVGVVARSSLQRLRARGVAALTEPRFGGGRPASEQQQQQSLPPYGSARCGTHPTASLQLANGRRPGAAVVSGREPVPALSGFAPVTPNGGDGNTAETAWWVNGSRRHTVSHTKSTAAQQCVPPPPPACMDGSLAESAAARDACALLNSVAANNWLRQSQRASAFANERDLRQHGWLGEPHHAAAACPPHTSTIVNHGNTPRGGATRSGTDDGESVLVGMRTTASSPSPKQQQQQQQQHPQPHPWPAPQVDPTSGAALTARARWFMFMALEIRWVPSPGLSPDERNLEVPPAAEARQEDDGDADDDGQHPFMLE